MRHSLVIAPMILATTFSSAAYAQEPAPAPAAQAPAAPDTAQAGRKESFDVAPPSPQAVSAIQLRGLAPSTGLRLDTTIAPYRSASSHLGYTETVSLFSASVKVHRLLALQARWGVMSSAPVTTGESATGTTNATVGALFGTSLNEHWRIAASGTVGLPTGAGGGNTPNSDMTIAVKSASLARAGMDNTMFAMNDVGFPVGGDLAYVRGPFTAQLEANIIPSFRVQGEKKSPDASKVNSTTALFVGYFILPNRLSVGGELRNMRYLSDPVAVQKDSSQRDNLSAAGGIRAYFKIAEGATARPGISYGAGLYGAIADARYQMAQVDLPVSF